MIHRLLILLRHTWRFIASPDVKLRCSITTSLRVILYSPVIRPSCNPPCVLRVDAITTYGIPFFPKLCYSIFFYLIAWFLSFSPLNPELNRICYLLALLTHHFLHVSRIRVKSLTLRLLMSYIYIYIYIYIWSTYS